MHGDFIHNFPFFKEIFIKIMEYAVLNKIYLADSGVTFYDIKKYGTVPHSRIYRILKRLEENGYLTKRVAASEVGRPKHIFMLTPEGKRYREELRTKIRGFFGSISEYFGNFRTPEKFIDHWTLDLWKTPIDVIMGSDMPDDEKLRILKEKARDLGEILKKIRRKIKELESRLNGNEREE